MRSPCSPPWVVIPSDTTVTGDAVGAAEALLLPPPCPAPAPAPAPIPGPSYPLPTALPGRDSTTGWNKALGTGGCGAAAAALVADDGCCTTAGASEGPTLSLTATLLPALVCATAPTRAATRPAAAGAALARHFAGGEGGVAALTPPPTLEPLPLLMRAVWVSLTFPAPLGLPNGAFDAVLGVGRGGAAAACRALPTEDRARGDCAVRGAVRGDSARGDSARREDPRVVEAPPTLVLPPPSPPPPLAPPPLALELARGDAAPRRRSRGALCMRGDSRQLRAYATSFSPLWSRTSDAALAWARGDVAGGSGWGWCRWLARGEMERARLEGEAAVRRLGLLV